ncbi:HAD family hydrolase [Pseudodesulfovibrio sp. zrk46]|uniref:HAD family hydrolase n=1 Tax=Pseudodesulfovibrio sp. zrk46 TaxID=2725288 RepID=UPI001449817A|nr:HAD family hydrolase [Pseudodesulfovibrio sp. zrk46]QJB55856.1 HAD family hydrolase [Pseudodesulfovibrio sp. zrk46]
MVIKGVVFDMDDTLCLERDYVKSGFRAVARHVGDVADEDAVFKAMWSMFESGVRGDTFNRLLDEFPAIADKYEIPELVEAYRTHHPDISIIPAMRKVIDALRAKGMPMGVLSDGPLASQKAKAEALGVGELVDKVVLTDALGREHWKPDTAGFELLSSSLGVEHNGLVYVGDNPVKDFIAPRKLGWLALRLRLPGQLREADEPADEAAAPHEEVGTIQELAARLGVDI